MPIPPFASLSSTTLRTMARGGVTAVPAVRYAVGIVGIVSAAVLAMRAATAPFTAAIGAVAMLAGMVLLIIVALLASAREPELRASLARPALALAWIVVVAAAVVLALMITITFWAEPTSWRNLHEAAQSCPVTVR